MKTKSLNLTITGIILVLAMLGQAFGQSGTQGFFSISGTVKDAGTKQPVAFANIYVPGSHVGTVANMEGNFTIKIQHDQNAKQIGISRLGYKSAEVDIEKVKASSSSEFLLESASIVLNEVIVRPHDPREIVLNALRKKDENYAKAPYLNTGFYRETIKQRRDYISIAEAVINIYHAPVHAPIRRSQVKIVQGRKSADVKTADTLVLKLQGGPNISNMLDIVRHGDLIVDINTIDQYDYELLDIVVIEDVPNYVIGFEPRVVLPYALYRGKLYISTESLAITMADFSLDLSDRQKAASAFVQRKPPRLRFTPRNTRYQVSYTKIDDKYHLNYIRGELEFFADWRRRIFRTNYTVMMEMAVTQRETADVYRFPTREAFRTRDVFADMVSVYFEEDFWGEYNYIEPDQSIKSAIMKLNKINPTSDNQ